MEQNNRKNGYWSGLISGLLLAILLIGCIYIGNRVFRIFEAKKIAEQNQTEDAELINEYTAAKVEVIENVFERSEAEFGNALKNDTTLPKDKEEKKEKEDKELTQDYQLSRAVDLVRALGIYGKQN